MGMGLSVSEEVHEASVAQWQERWSPSIEESMAKEQAGAGHFAVDGAPPGAMAAVAAVAVAHRRLRGSGPETATRASRKLREPVLRLWLALVGLMC